MKTVLLTAALTAVLYSCHKSADDIGKPQLTQQDLLGKYKITELLFQSEGKPDKDLLSTLPACSQDDLLVFGTGSKFTTEDAGLPCDQPEPEPTAWFIKGNKLNIDGVESEIVSFDNHQLVLTTPMMFFGTEGIVIETLERQ